jgi:hypothetical protein
MQRLKPNLGYRPEGSPTRLILLPIAKSMESVGFTRRQAERMTEEQAKLIDERIAIKEDLERLNTDMTTEIKRLETSMTTEIKRLETSFEKTADRTKYEILKWMFGQTVVIIIAVIGILRAGLY